MKYVFDLGILAARLGSIDENCFFSIFRSPAQVRDSSPSAGRLRAESKFSRFVFRLIRRF